jgi:diacylglycerol kinase (ATP)
MLDYRGRLIYNPTAGSFPSGMIGEQVKSLLADYGWDLEICQSERGEHVTRLSADAAEKQFDAVFIAGGDGTINLALEGLMDTETALGILPAGTSNVMAQELGLAGLHLVRATSLVSAARKLMHGSIQKTDVGICNGKPFLMWAGIGLDGFIVHRIEPRKSWEKQLSVLHYASKAVWNAHLWSGVEMEIKTGDQSVKGSYLMAVASNIRLYVGGFAELSPSAMLDDGMMDLWVFEGNSPIDVYQRALDLFSRRHLHSQHTYCLPFKHATIESDTGLYTQLDAEPFSEKNKIELKVNRQSLNLIVPNETKAGLYHLPAVKLLTPAPE